MLWLLAAFVATESFGQPWKPPVSTGTYECLDYNVFTDWIEITSSSCTTEEVVIPETIEGLPVHWLGPICFENSPVSSVIIPENARSIGYTTFSGSNITSIDIPRNIIAIGNLAFWKCINLTAIEVAESNPAYSSLDGVLFNKDRTILESFPGGLTGAYAVPDGVLHIGYSAFLDCALTSVTMPDGLQSIQDSAFAHSPNLTHVTLGAGLTNIKDSAFLECSNLTKVTLGDGPTHIEDMAFKNCSNLTELNLGNGIVSIGVEAFYNCNSLTSLTIPDSVTIISPSAFRNCQKLVDITIGNSVSAIHEYAFADCPNLTNITIKDGLTFLGNRVFWGCENLEAINISENNSSYTSVDGVLFNKDKTRLERFPTGRSGEYTIPHGVSEIAYRAFDGCLGLTSVTIPDSVKIIGMDAFSGCSNLTRVMGGNGLVTIGIQAFHHCISLSEITLPNNLQTIEFSAFEHCESLTGINIPETVIEIKAGTFVDCSSLAEITIHGNLTSLQADVFDGCSSLGAFNVSEANPVYSSIDGVLFNKNKSTLLRFPQSSTLDSYTIPDGVARINEDAFRNCSLSSVTITGGISTIPRYTFSGCDNLVEIVLGENVTSIEDYAFWNCTSLKIVSLPDSLASISKGTFYNCTNLEEVFLGKNVNSIKESAFRDCSSLTNIDLPDSLTSIDSVAFAGCSSLTTIDVPDSLTQIATSAFSISNLQDFSVTETHPTYASIDGVLFNKDRTELLLYPDGRQGQYRIPEGVTTIGRGSVTGIWGLTKLILPASISTIKENAIYGNVNLADVYFLGAPPESGGYVFDFSSPDLKIHYTEGTPGWTDAFTLIPKVPFNLWGSFFTVSDLEGELVNTGTFLGWLEITQQPWIWSYTVESWLYIPEQVAEDGSGWLYIPDLAFDSPGLWLNMVEDSDWGWSYSLSCWLYITASGWVFLI